MDIVNFDALTANNRIIDPSQVDPEEDYFILGKYTNHYTTNSQKYTKYPVYAIKAGDVMGTQPTYKVYSALVSQSGSLPTSAPTAIILENTLGVIPTWGRTNVGDYFVQAIGKFTLDKTTISIGIPNYSVFISAPALPIVDQDTLRLVTKSAVDVNTDGRLKKTFIEIRVYN